MSGPRTSVHSGGCQCGAVRYALYDEPTDASICHCRMCQKAFGSYFAPLADVKLEAFVLTRGALSKFRSSAAVERGFCSTCGTPLSFRYVDEDKIAIALGSLDHPERVPLRRQYGLESRLAWIPQLDLPGAKTEDSSTQEHLTQIASANYQHPDHDTDSWPPAGASA
ncbi:MAG: GFA family protein [Hyphomicrobium sp.]